MASKKSSESFKKVLLDTNIYIDWMNDGLLPLSSEFAVEDRLQIVEGDIYEDLLGPAAEHYDLILVDVDHSPSDRLSNASEPFYTEQGQRRVSRHLRPGGMLAVWSSCDNDDFFAVLAEVYSAAHREDVKWEDIGLCDEPLHDVLFFSRVASA